MDTSKEFNMAPQRDNEPSTADSSSSNTSSNPDNEDPKLYPHDTSVCSNSGCCPTPSPISWNPAEPTTISIGYASSEDVNIPELLLPDPCINYNHDIWKERNIQPLVYGKLQQRSYPHRAAQQSENGKSIECSPKTSPQDVKHQTKDLNHMSYDSDSQFDTQWRIILVPDLVSGYVGDITLGIFRATFTLIPWHSPVWKDAEDGRVGYDVHLPNTPKPGVPWYPIPSPGPYKPKPKPKPNHNDDGHEEDVSGCSSS